MNISLTKGNCKRSVVGRKIEQAAREALAKTDRRRVDAMTDADIARQIAAQPTPRPTWRPT